MSNIQLMQGDCIELMRNIPDMSVDLIITDPPYKLTARGNGGNSGGMFQKKEVSSGRVFKHNDIDIVDWLTEFYRILKPDSHCYIMTNNKNITHYLNVIDKSDFHFIKNLIWVKDNKIMGQAYMSQFEYIIFIRKGSYKRINNCGDSDVLQIANRKMKNSENKTVHDTEKPVELTNILIANSTSGGDTVLDPFMGIGGAGVSCKKLNRDFIGIELDENYFNIAKSRIDKCANEHRIQSKLF